MDGSKTVSADGSFTEDMILAAGKALDRVHDIAEADGRLTDDAIAVLTFAAIYQAMLAAAPEYSP